MVCQLFNYLKIIFRITILKSFIFSVYALINIKLLISCLISENNRDVFSECNQTRQRYIGNMHNINSKKDFSETVYAFQTFRKYTSKFYV